jgi:hypothetical protein
MTSLTISTGKTLIALIMAVLFLSSCSDKKEAQHSDSLPASSEQAISYHDSIQPIFNKYCVACHACYDSPCQLNLQSADGLLRGAHQSGVYNGARIDNAEPTRMGIDAESVQQWRAKGFISVVETIDGNHSIMHQALLAGQNTKLTANAKLPEDIPIGIKNKYQCITSAESAAWSEMASSVGMPLGVTGMTEKESTQLLKWLTSGFVVDASPNDSLDNDSINKWETLLNNLKPKNSLVSRWVYEHLFMAHLYFDKSGSSKSINNQSFYRLVRSSTAAGKPIKEIPTRRANDAINTEFFYRFKPLHKVIVHKTHIVFPLTDNTYNTITEDFISSDWTVSKLPLYDENFSSNPLKTFSDIPAKARYRFMLNHAEYFVRTFIRGPVCRGQVATDVIRDNFWVLFQSPEHDPLVMDKDYYNSASNSLALPIGSKTDISLPSNLMKFSALQNDYISQKQAIYKRLMPRGQSIKNLWAGNENAMLTVFRHHDNAVVNAGWVGAIPKTIWVMDYANLERSYYNLVVNFDVFGNVSHQLQTRLYFDLIRNEAEQHFLSYIPSHKRKSVFSDWYQDLGIVKNWLSYESVDLESKTQIKYKTKQPVHEFANLVLERFSDINQTNADSINRCNGSCKGMSSVDRKWSEIASIKASNLPVLDFLPNLTVIRLYESDPLSIKDRLFFSLIRNRDHSNVAFMFGESLRYQADNDTLTIVPKIMSSYPNYMFNVARTELDEFIKELKNIEGKSDFEKLVGSWGVRRSHPDFWFLFHDMTTFDEEKGFATGIYDLSRYLNL